MRSIMSRCLGVLLLAPLACIAQQWELGGAAGYGFYRNKNITRGTATATAGFEPALRVSAVGSQHPFRYLSGEFRYVYSPHDLMVKSGGSKYTFSGDSHIVHYDALVNFTPKGSRVRPYFAFGGGIKVYRGLGTEIAAQPLSNLAILTRTTELKPLASVGGGVSWRLGRHASLRLDIRDYITPFPSQVVMPAPGARASGWMHDFTPMLGISAHF